MYKNLIKLANHLDSKGFTKEADYIDAIVRQAMGPDLMETPDSNTLRPMYDAREDDPGYSPSSVLDNFDQLTVEEKIKSPKFENLQMQFIEGKRIANRIVGDQSSVLTALSELGNRIMMQNNIDMYDQLDMMHVDFMKKGDSNTIHVVLSMKPEGEGKSKLVESKILEDGKEVRRDIVMFYYEHDRHATSYINQSLV